MRISEVARLAGVSARSIRHYHWLGILAEPARISGDYRDYKVADLVRVIHIRYLSEAGIPLRKVPRILDDRAAGETLENGSPCSRRASPSASSRSNSSARSSASSPIE